MRRDLLFLRLFLLKCNSIFVMLVSQPVVLLSFGNIITNNQKLGSCPFQKVILNLHFSIFSFYRLLSEKAKIKLLILFYFPFHIDVKFDFGNRYKYISPFRQFQEVCGA